MATPSKENGGSVDQLELVARSELLGVDPAALVVDPEWVLAGRGDHVAVDLDVDEMLLAVAEDRVDHAPRTALASLRLGGPDVVADLDVLDRLRRTVTMSTGCAGNEACWYETVYLDRQRSGLPIVAQITALIRGRDHIGQRWLTVGRECEEHGGKERAKANYRSRPR